MDAKERWILYIQKFPQHYEVSKSKLYMKIISLFGKETKNFDALRKQLPGVEEKDFETIINSLVNIGLVRRIKVGPSIFFTLSDAGRKFLKEYNRTRKGFKIDK